MLPGQRGTEILRVADGVVLYDLLVKELAEQEGNK